MNSSRQRVNCDTATVTLSDQDRRENMTPAVVTDARSAPCFLSITEFSDLQRAMEAAGYRLCPHIDTWGDMTCQACGRSAGASLSYMLPTGSRDSLRRACHTFDVCFFCWYVHEATFPEAES